MNHSSANIMAGMADLWLAVPILKQSGSCRSRKTKVLFRIVGADLVDGEYRIVKFMPAFLTRKEFDNYPRKYPPCHVQASDLGIEKDSKFVDQARSWGIIGKNDKIVKVEKLFK